jgi:hypothetical protein
LGLFDPRLPFTTDWEMWLRFALFYDIGYLIKPLVKYRRHAENETLKFVGVKALDHSYRAKMMILEKYSDLIREIDSARQKVTENYVRQALEIARYHYRQRENPQARDFLAFAFQTYGSVFGGSHPEWLLQPLEQMWQLEPEMFQETLNHLSGQDIAQRIPIKKLIQALGLKITGRLFGRRANQNHPEPPVE